MAKRHKRADLFDLVKDHLCTGVRSIIADYVDVEDLEATISQLRLGIRQLYDVDYQTEEMGVAACQNDPSNYLFVDDKQGRFKESLNVALSECGHSHKYFTDRCHTRLATSMFHPSFDTMVRKCRMQTARLASIRLHHDPAQLEFIDTTYKTTRLCQYATSRQPDTLQFVPIRRMNVDMVLRAVAEDRDVIKFVPPALCKKVRDLFSPVIDLSDQ